MEETNTLTILDESGQEKEVTILNTMTIDNKEYIVYSIEENENEEAIYASKLIKNEMGEEDIIPIVDEEEKRIVSEAIKEVINDLD